jgi:probable phosphoglycerate mutase
LEATRILAIRHGETAWNVDTRIQGHLDIPLNDTGRRQARRLAEAVAGEPLAAVYASDLARAKETAGALADEAGVEVVLHDGLRERAFGAFEGLTFDEIAARWPDQALRWRQRDPEFASPGGETLRAFYARCIDTVTALASRHRGGQIAIVSHGGVMDCLYRAATRADLAAPRTWRLGNASINRLLHTPQGFSLVGWSDTQHLERETLDEA